VDRVKTHPELRALRLKNRFLHPTPAGFRDLNLNVVVSGMHVAEIQVTDM
jgi:hypothetical protein